MQILLTLLIDSYQTINLPNTITINIDSVLPLLGKLVHQSFMLASPVLLTLLLSEILLGVLSRFTPQLNAFSISLTVKSMIAFTIFILYFGPVLPDKMMSMVNTYFTLDLLNVE